MTRADLIIMAFMCVGAAGLAWWTRNIEANQQPTVIPERIGPVGPSWTTVFGGLASLVGTVLLLAAFIYPFYVVGHFINKYW